MIASGFIGLCAVFAPCVYAADAGGVDTIMEMIAKSATPAGRFVVHVGATDGLLEKRLVEQGCVVQGLVSSEKEKTALRQKFADQAIYGPASLDVWLPKTSLPYPDRLADVVVVDRTVVGTEALSDDEVMRVICPDGIAVIRSQDQWSVVRKPRLKEMGEWLHPMHDVHGTQFADDSAVEPPDTLCWLNGPEKLGRPNVVTRDVLFGFHGGAWAARDYGTMAAYNAHNGIRLWEKPVKMMQSADVREWVKKNHGADVGFYFVNPYRPWTYSYGSNGKQLVVASLPKPVCLDLVTGRMIAEFPLEGPVWRVLCLDDLAVFSAATGVYAFDLQTGKQRWAFAGTRPLDLLCDQGRVAFVDLARTPAELVVVHAKDGQVTGKWACPGLFPAETGERYPAPLPYQIVSFLNDTAYVLRSYQEQKDMKHWSWDWKIDALLAFDVKQGKPKWTFSTEKAEVNRINSPGAVIVSPETVWIICSDPQQPTPNRAIAKPVLVTLATDTGAIRQKIPVNGLGCNPPWGNSKYLNLAWGRWFDHAGKAVHGGTFLVVKSCGFYHVPANGRIYGNAHPCYCYGDDERDAFSYMRAVEKSNRTKLNKVTDESLVPGEGNVRLDKDEPKPGVWWPTWAADRNRTRHVSWTLKPDGLKTAWESSAVVAGKTSSWTKDAFNGDAITGLTAAGGRIYFAQPERNAVVAIDFATGNRKWEFLADGRVDSPPTIAGNGCFFGDEAGWVYAVATDTGKLIWKHRLTPSDLQIIDHDRPRSYWPIKGNVLVYDQRVWVLCGWYVETGVDAFVLNAADGKLLWTSLNANGASSRWFSKGEALYENQGAVIPYHEAPGSTYSPIRIDQYTKTSYRDIPYQGGVIYGMTTKPAWTVVDQGMLYAIFNMGEQRVQLPFHKYQVLALRETERPPWQRNIDTKKILWRLDLAGKKESGAALISTGDVLWVTAYPDESPDNGILRAMDKKTGNMLAEYKLPGKPVVDGLAAAKDSLLVSLSKGTVLRMQP